MRAGLFTTKSGLEKSSAKLSSKLDTAEVKSQASRNEYLLCLAACNAQQTHYYSRDLPDLIRVYSRPARAPAPPDPAPHFMPTSCLPSFPITFVPLMQLGLDRVIKGFSSAFFLCRDQQSKHPFTENDLQAPYKWLELADLSHTFHVIFLERISVSRCTFKIL